MILKLDDIPTTSNRILTDLSVKRPCDAASTPIYIRADPRLKYQDFNSLVTQLKAGGYVRVYMYPLNHQMSQ